MPLMPTARPIVLRVVPEASGWTTFSLAGTSPSLVGYPTLVDLWTLIYPNPSRSFWGDAAIPADRQ